MPFLKVVIFLPLSKFNTLTEVFMMGVNIFTINIVWQTFPFYICQLVNNRQTISTTITAPQGRMMSIIITMLRGITLWG
ncbi:hypothetical protein MNBD_BACTEROID06-1300 [hydrothermal vent metagenome]|uniref:Uncharacterized protein n=1 Tax=hydrothermal vent metagenome TaxID=652676 RepID=A0A3B0UE50_9ZZZZ